MDNQRPQGTPPIVALLIERCFPDPQLTIKNSRRYEISTAHAHEDHRLGVWTTRSKTPDWGRPFWTGIQIPIHSIETARLHGRAPSRPESGFQSAHTSLTAVTLSGRTCIPENLFKFFPVDILSPLATPPTGGAPSGPESGFQSAGDPPDWGAPVRTRKK